MYKEDTFSHITIILMIALFSILLSFGLMNVLSTISSDAVISISAGLLIVSFLVSSLAFRETIGIMLMTFVIALILSSVLLRNINYGLFASAVMLVILVLANIFKH